MKVGREKETQKKKQMIVTECVESNYTDRQIRYLLWKFHSKRGREVETDKEKDEIERYKEIEGKRMWESERESFGNCFSWELAEK